MCAAPYRTRSPGSLGNLPARASTSRARLHSSRRREQPVTSCAPGCVIHYATQRRRQNCFYACVHYVHTSREPSASPFPASSHKKRVLPPAPARRAPTFSGATLNTPCAFRPSRGGRVGRAYAGSRSSHGFRSSKVAAFAAESSPPGNHRARLRKASACHAGCEPARRRCGHFFL